MDLWLKSRLPGRHAAIGVLSPSHTFFIRSFLILIVAFALSGCVRNLTTIASDADVNVVGNDLQLLIAADSPSGTYKLETADGRVLSQSDFKPPRRTGFMPGARYPVALRVNHRTMDASTVTSCLRIRRPDNELVSIGITRRKEFKVPAFEANWIKHKKIPEIRRTMGAIQQNENKLKRTRSWLNSHPNVYKNGACHIPLSGSPPASACRSEREAKSRFHEVCFSANFGCAIAGATADSVSSAITNRGEVSALANLLAANSCSLLHDRAYGQKSDPWVYLRANGVAWLTEALYRSMVNDNPGIEEKYVIAAIAGGFNYGLCIDDQTRRCLNVYERWQRPAANLYKQCKSVRQQQMAAIRFNARHGGDARQLQAQLEENQQRLNELADGGFLGRRGRALREITSCD